MVAAYFDWPWRARLADVLDGGAGVLEDWERSVAFLRLANEVEERVDGADGYAPGHAAFVFPLDDVVRCARHLGRNELVTFAEERIRVALEAPHVVDDAGAGRERRARHARLHGVDRHRHAERRRRRQHRLEPLHLFRVFPAGIRTVTVFSSFPRATRAAIALRRARAGASASRPVHPEMSPPGWQPTLT